MANNIEYEDQKVDIPSEAARPIEEKARHDRLSHMPRSNAGHGFARRHHRP